MPLAPNIILIGDFCFPSGGGPTSRIRNLALGFVAQGCRVHILPLSQRPGTVPQPQDPAMPPGDAITCVYAPSVLSRQSGATALPLRNRRFAEKVRWFWRTYGMRTEMHARLLDVLTPGALVIVYGRSYARLAWIIRAARHRGITVLWDVVEIVDVFSGFGGRLSPIYWDWQAGSRIFPRLVNGLTVISHALAQRLQTPVSRAVLVVPALGAWTGPPRVPATPDGAFSLLYVGALLAKDAADLMLDTMRELAVRGSPVLLKVAGRYAQTQEGQHRAATIQNDPLLRDRVHLLGAPSDAELARLMAGADGLLLMRQNAETEIHSFPTRLVEYLQQGLPVFVSAVGDVSLYLRDGVDAVLLDPQEAGRIADRIEEALMDRAQLPAIGAQGWQRGRECFDRDRHAAQILAFVARL